MNKITEAQLAAEHADYGRKMLFFAMQAWSYDAERAYLAQAVEYQKTSALLYRADRIARGIEVA
jgi:hypothetical protein